MLANDSNIPLFPLDVVLFPGMMLPLHIFEDRYKAMIRECLGSDQLFGVVLAKNNQAKAPDVGNLDSDDLYSVGTTARIAAVENLEDDRMNLITVGQDRFIIKNIQPSKDDFIIGQVGPYPLQEDDDPLIIEAMVQRLRSMVKRYLDHLGDASGEDLSDAALPADPMGLAYLAGAAIQGSLPDKQKLLSATSLTALVADTMSVLDREDKILAYMLKAYDTHQQIQKPLFVDYSLN